jgi:nitroreductase
MTSVVEDKVTHALRRAAVRATYAPSVHNTQPWKFVITSAGLEIHADAGRQLRVLDATGRQLFISCGCALFNARVALAASGYSAVVERFPDPTQPTLLARLTVADADPQSAKLAELDVSIEVRRTNRRRFLDDAVPAEIVAELVSAAQAEGAGLVAITRLEHRLATASLSQQADRQQNSDPAYRAELRAWTTADSSRRDGVATSAVPHVDGGAHDDIPIRDYDSQGEGSLPSETRSSLNQCLLLLGSIADNPNSWLRAGEALEAVLLQVAGRGLAASPLTQVVEVTWTRARLREALGTRLHPVVLLRVGRAPAMPATRRRRLVDVLADMTGR